MPTEVSKGLGGSIRRGAKWAVKAHAEDVAREQRVHDAKVAVRQGREPAPLPWGRQPRPDNAWERNVTRVNERKSAAASANNVGKRMSGGSFTRGGSTIVAHGKTKVERSAKLQRYSGNGVKHGTRLLEHFSKGVVGDLKTGMAVGRDLRPGMLVPAAGKVTPGGTAGKLLGAATATAPRTAATIGSASLLGMAAGRRQNVNKGPVWQPTSVAMNAQPITPSNGVSTAPKPVSSAAGGQMKPGMLVPTSKPAQGNVAGRAAGGQKSGSIRANGTMGSAATLGSVGTTAAAQPTKKAVAKADGTLLVRSHGPNHRNYDPESRRQRRLGQAQALTGAGGAASAAGGIHHLKRLHRDTKVTAREGVSTAGASTALRGVTPVSRRGATMVGAGVLGLAASNRIRRHANSPHNREYS